MNGEKYTQLSAAVEDMGLEITPEPGLAQDVRYFAVVTEGGAIATERVLEAFHTTLAAEGSAWSMPKLVGDREYRLTFDDADPDAITEIPELQR